MSILYTHILPVFYIQRTTLLKICGIILVLIIILLPCVLYLDIDVGITIRRKSSHANDTTKIKTILYWTKMFADKNFYFGEGKVFRNCPVSACYGTHERDFLGRLEDYDAILFHGIQLNESDLPRSRSSRQRYVFVNMESPANWRLDNTYVPDKFYNWTMTYRMDSDIPRPYGNIVNKKTKKIVYPVRDHEIDNRKEVYAYVDLIESRNSTKFQVSKKSGGNGEMRTVAWFVSHCKTTSDRERYVAELQRYVDVDVYGKCGARKCQSNDDRCYEMLESRYRFYLSFENSLCEDYVTEKLYKVMRYNVVPIVFGAANYSKFVPPRSYINVADYESPGHLARHLLYLRSNDIEYEKYFWWKEFYEVDLGHDSTLCRMCEMLHRDEMSFPEVIVGLKDWWTKGQCRDIAQFFKRII